MANSLITTRRLDAHSALRVTPTTLQRYRAQAQRFSEWSLARGFSPSTACEWDSLLLEFKNSQKYLRKHDFSTLLAAVEFFFSEAKGALPRSHASLKGWEISYSTRHTVPMGRAIATLFSSYMASRGNPRLGIALYLQVRKGLRPGELFDIRRSDVVLPSDINSTDSPGSCIIGLGIRASTKAKRPQSVIVFPYEFPQLMEVLNRICTVTAPNAKLFPYTIEQYRKEIHDIQDLLNIDFGFSAHSPRAGFASEGRARGLSFTELREQGRWVADSSLRVYIDTVAASHISIALRAKGLVPALEFASRHILEYFPISSLASVYDTRFRRKTVPASR